MLHSVLYVLRGVPVAVAFAQSELVQRREAARSFVFLKIRGALGLAEQPTDLCVDKELSYLDPDSVVRVVHSDLPSMLIGGLASLFIQTLHPDVVLGVDQHSTYRDDPFGRLNRTASFIGVTTFGTKAEALAAISRVRCIHDRVSGVTSNGTPYAANNPDLLLWVHVTEVYSFLEAYVQFGPRGLTALEQDIYVRDMAVVARDLGVLDPPETVSDLVASMESYGETIDLSTEARATRNFLLRGVRHKPHEFAVYGLLVAAALQVTPRWARQTLRLPKLPYIDRVFVRPPARAVARAVRFFVPGA